MTSGLISLGAAAGTVADRHAALDRAVARAARRDLDRLRRVLADPVTAVRRGALVEHAGFVLDQLRAQHRWQDEALWPAVIERRPDLAEAADRAHRWHADLIDPIENVMATAMAWKTDVAARARMRGRVDELLLIAGPVLDLDAELVPLACAAVEAEQWAVLGRRGARPGLPTRLARRTFWLLDGTEAATAESAGPQLSRLTMWVLRNGFSGGYNRSAHLMWLGGGTGPAQ